MKPLLVGFAWAFLVVVTWADDQANSPAGALSDENDRSAPVFQLIIRPSSAEKHSVQTTGGGRDIVGNSVKYSRIETGYTAPELISSIYSEHGPHLLIEASVPEGRFDILIDSTSGGRLQTEMLQTLRRTAIEAAFGLKSEHETHSLEAYVLSVSRKDAIGLHPAKNPNMNQVEAGVGHISAVNVKLAVLVARLESLVKQPVADETGLVGNYDFDLNWEPNGSDEPTTARLIDAVRNQLGLDVRKANRPIDVLVVHNTNKARESQSNPVDK